jgi:hypothetical protein
LALHAPVEINIPLPINIQFSESLDVIKTVFNYYNPYYRGGLLGLCGMNPIINSFGGQLVNALLLFEEFHTPCILTKNV